MMICKADFEELFPDLFKPEPVAETRQTANPATLVTSPSAGCFARWEDDGGQEVPAKLRRRAVSSARPQYAGVSRPGPLDLAMPVTAAYAAAWATLYDYGQPKTDRRVLVTSS
ncbi:hypothetical protein SAMN06295998_1137 [Primorskyibacter flagellatus]|uniref:Uncharacterized protein n=1 Tax=Primorskyibacter flagellatus TaxID=1387277 RepID=A0A1W2DDM3_9RHOB|nr:hypothetical protein SAMN06295998_1137 [Primorskyibacter flagellatus]